VVCRVYESAADLTPPMFMGNCAEGALWRRCGAGLEQTSVAQLRGAPPDEMTERPEVGLRPLVRQTPTVRIGTWNLQGRWDQRHLDHIQAMRCDVLLLTEVSDKVELPAANIHPSVMRMAPRRYWAAIASHLPLNPLADPHGASAMAEIDGLRVCSSILPWRSCGTREPWAGSNTAEKTVAAITSITAAVPSVWGGDWNHAMSGREWSGSQQGRRSILDAVDQLGLQLPTAGSPHQLEGLLSIDHMAVPADWTVLAIEHHSAVSGGAMISDHDAYVVEVRMDTR
jgi:endonuclease/exonuclease/phosphatase family metal-dependent hydrolase